MVEENFNDIEGKTIKDINTKTNPKFYSWAKKVLQFNVMRSTKLNTFLVNFSIEKTFFPWFSTLMNEIPSLMPDNLDNSKLNDFMIGSDRIYGFFIFLPMKYKSTNENTEEQTDRNIDKLWSYSPMVNNFFFYNSIRPNLQNIDLKPLLTVSKNFVIKKSLIPELSFDPEYKKVINCEALKQIYDTSFISDFFNSRLPKKPKYLPNRNLLLKQLHSYKNKSRKLFDIDSNLRFSKFMLNYLNYYPVSFIGSHEQIDEIIQVFKEYFIKRIPSKKGEISKNLTGFGSLLKITEGKLYCEFRFGQIVKKLSKDLEKVFVTQFMKRFCLNKENNEFPKTYEDFNAYDFVKKYNSFLSYALYNLHGLVYTGVLLIWRALIKYLESLQKLKKFKDKKAALLENWCYNKAIEFKFDPKKILLINPKRKPTSKYYKMKKQIRQFPKSAIIEENVFFPKEVKGYFREIDFVIKVDKYLFMFECKGTRVPKGEQEEFINWIENFYNNYQTLLEKGELLIFNLSKKKLNIPSLEGVKVFIPFQIQIEGIISTIGGMSLEGYIRLLEDVRTHVNNGTFKDYINQLTSNN